MKQYLTPDFDVTVYEIEDVITVSYIDGDLDVDDGKTDWGN